jgi:hypothetical protein
MTIIPTSLCVRSAGRTFRSALALLSAATILMPGDLAAQGLPVQNGPMIPVALWWFGAIVLGLAIAYGILNNRRRTRAEEQRTERATKNLQADEARDEAAGRI